MRKILSFNLLCLLMCLSSQSASSFSLSNSEIYEKVSPAVVTVLAGKGDNTPEKIASGVIIRTNGVILTSYLTVKDAAVMQIRLKNGEIFDKVDLLGFDEDGE